MAILYKFLLILCLITIFFSCSSKQHKIDIENERTTSISNQSGSISSKADTNTIQKLILKEFEKWKGTPHKMGGNSKNGIDCSGFVHHIYTKLFNIYVPRTTKLLFNTGVRIDKSQLKPGDLVAFMPHSYPRHVGIYTGNNKFIHASTTKGVVMSDLANPYWKKHYLMSRRIIKN